MMLLSDHIKISRQFLRSIRIDLDWGNENALRGFVCQKTAKHVIESMSQQYVATKQAAYTWTGPFGGGKSSLALAFASLLGGDKKLRAMASELLGEDIVSSLKKPLGLNSNHDPWLVIPVVGRRADPVADIWDAVKGSGIPNIGRRLSGDVDSRKLVKTLVDIAESRSNDGALLIVDELGKYLEYAATHGGDIHFFQDLAESASRCNGRLLVVGVLHQAFDQYAARLGKESRDEWSKIQGRFVDIPLVAATDEVLELTARAIDHSLSHAYSEKLSRSVASSIKHNRPAAPQDLNKRLDSCWPLHPITAALLGPVSKQRFGQNARSIFGLLSSAEPYGFDEFLRTTSFESKRTYGPEEFWNYLRENLEASILASPVGHRWAQSVDAVERCQSKGSKLHQILIKAIALIDLFRNGSGLVANTEVLSTCVPDIPKGQVEKALEEMASWSQIVFRKHLNSWAIYQGSDFDIDAALSTALGGMHGIEIEKLSRLANLQPVLPKRHYQESGALRWFGLGLVAAGDLQKTIAQFDPRTGISGQFFLVMPTNGESHKSLQKKCKESSKGAQYPIAVGVPKNVDSVTSLGREYLALESIRANQTELNSDPVARRELKARTIAVLGKLQDALTQASDTAQWYVNGVLHQVDYSIGLSGLASELANESYACNPRIFSELLNRHSVSTNTQGAINALIERMVLNGSEENLGIAGFPVERGLYATVLQALGLHQKTKSGTWEIIRPTGKRHSDELQNLWGATDHYLTQHSQITLNDVFDLWAAPPYGVRNGVRSILALAYILTSTDRIALYVDGTYKPEVTIDLAREIVRDPGCISLRFVAKDSGYNSLFQSLTSAIQMALNEKCKADPLAVGRTLVRFVFNLPSWTQKTTSLPARVSSLRNLLLKASDPHKLLEDDIPNLYDKNCLEKGLAQDLTCLRDSYSKLLHHFQTKLLDGLAGEFGDLSSLRHRAKVIQDVGTDYRLASFATRLAEFDGSDAAVEKIASLAINLPASDWTNASPQSIEFAMADLALKFRHSEMLADILGEPTRHAIGLVFGTGSNGKALMKAVDIGQDERQRVSDLAKAILKVQIGQTDSRLLLAALAEAGSTLLEQKTAKA